MQLPRMKWRLPFSWSLRGSTYKRQKSFFVWSSLIPVLVLYGLFTIYPVFRALDVSLRDWNLLEDVHPINDFANYTWALNDDTFWISMKNTIFFTIAHVGTSILLGLIIAVLVFSLKQPWKGIMTTILFLPVMTSLIAISLVFRDLFSTVTGPLNYLIRFVGLGPYNYLGEGTTAMASLIGFTIWKGLGIYVVILMAGLTTIPGELLEAASIDGASGFQSFIHIKIPLLIPTLVYVVVTGTIASLQVFGQIFVLTGGGPGTATRTLVIHLYEQGFQFFNMGRASAIAFILFLLIMCITVIYLRFMRHQFEY
jgi:ABC-type sugar transport system permease subunit